jgi:hypothetical protein
MGNMIYEMSYDNTAITMGILNRIYKIDILDGIVNGVV